VTLHASKRRTGEWQIDIRSVSWRQTSGGHSTVRSFLSANLSADTLPER
jgi:hypothetical protein